MKEQKFHFDCHWQTFLTLVGPQLTSLHSCVTINFCLKTAPFLVCMLYLKVSHGLFSDLIAAGDVEFSKFGAVFSQGNDATVCEVMNTWQSQKDEVRAVDRKQTHPFICQITILKAGILQLLTVSSQGFWNNVSDIFHAGNSQHLQFWTAVYNRLNYSSRHLKKKQKTKNKVLLILRNKRTFSYWLTFLEPLRLMLLNCLAFLSFMKNGIKSDPVMFFRLQRPKTFRAVQLLEIEAHDWSVRNSHVEISNSVNVRPMLFVI